MPSKCSAALIELINALKREIPDEQAANAKYSEMATKVVHFRASGEPIPGGVLALNTKILHKLASDEASHAEFLEAMTDMLTKECGTAGPLALTREQFQAAKRKAAMDQARK